MARIVILSFEDNKVAEDFARDMLSDTGQRAFLRLSGTKIEAMIARPTSGCKGPHRIPGRIKPERGFTRTKRFGWYVCGICKKPAKTVVENLIRNMLGGYNNLLPELEGGAPEKPYWVRETLHEVQLEMNRR